MTSESIIPRRILIADEDEDAVEILKILLTLDGHDVRSAFNGKDAHRTAVEFQPEVVMLYVGLRDIEGTEAAEHYARVVPDARLVALIDWRQEDDPYKWRNIGYHTRLIKPVELRHVTDLLKETFGGHQKDGN
jgi:DNA-binding response OmpR family regulator